MIDLVNDAKEMAVATPKKLDKSSYKGISDKNARKEAKKAYRADEMGAGYHGAAKGGKCFGMDTENE